MYNFSSINSVHTNIRTILYSSYHARGGSTYILSALEWLEYRRYQSDTIDYVQYRKETSFFAAAVHFFYPMNCLRSIRGSAIGKDSLCWKRALRRHCTFYQQKSSSEIFVDTIVCSSPQTKGARDFSSVSKSEVSKFSQLSRIYLYFFTWKFVSGNN